MIDRLDGPRLHRLLRLFPAVTLLGARQCGKTTFAQRALPGWTYLDLERPSDAEPLRADPEARLAQLGDHVILDEAQRVPELFPVLRSVIDARRARRGRFLLLGSAAPSLVRGVSESLAGRTAFVELPGLRWDEVHESRPTAHIKRAWLRGGFPEAWLARSDADWQAWSESYVRAFVERDLPALGIDIAPARIRTLWAMLAHCSGQVWNASRLASSLGVSYHTVNHHVEILEQSFLVRRLKPYHANIGKRLMKSPKVYLRDTGLMHHFLGIRSQDELDVHPARGASWETFVVDQIISSLEREAPATEVFYWRTASGDEVDLLAAIGGALVPIEIKLHTSPDAADASRLRRCMADLNLPQGWLVHAGRETYSLGGGITAVPAADALMSPGPWLPSRRGRKRNGHVTDEE